MKDIRRFIIKRLLKLLGINQVSVRDWFMIRVWRAGKQQWENVLESKPNLIVNAGLAYVANLLGDAAGTNPTKFTHGRIGSDNTAPANGDTDVKSILGTGQAVVATKETTAVTDDTEVFKSTHTCTDGGGWAVVEYALANQAAGGTVLNRVTFAAINLALDDVLEFTYKVQVQR
jgi:hypothetical protein